MLRLVVVALIAASAEAVTCGVGSPCTKGQFCNFAQGSGKGDCQSCLDNVEDCKLEKTKSGQEACRLMCKTPKLADAKEQAEPAYGSSESAEQVLQNIEQQQKADQKALEDKTDDGVKGLDDDDDATDLESESFKQKETEVSATIAAASTTKAAEPETEPPEPAAVGAPKEAEDGQFCGVEHPPCANGAFCDFRYDEQGKCAQCKDGKKHGFKQPSVQGEWPSSRSLIDEIDSSVCAHVESEKCKKARQMRCGKKSKAGKKKKAKKDMELDTKETKKVAKAKAQYSLGTEGERCGRSFAPCGLGFFCDFHAVDGKTGTCLSCPHKVHQQPCSSKHLGLKPRGVHACVARCPKEAVLALKTFRKTSKKKSHGSAAPAPRIYEASGSLTHTASKSRAVSGLLPACAMAIVVVAAALLADRRRRNVSSRTESSVAHGPVSPTLVTFQAPSTQPQQPHGQFDDASRLSEL